jgi:rhamnosyltransferase subunit B
MRRLQRRCSELDSDNADSIIHHGGIGSASQGLAAGISQVVMPLAHDQFDNAERLTRLGVGSWIHANRFSGRRLAQHPLCKTLAHRLETGDGLRRAAAAIEDRPKGAGSQMSVWITLSRAEKVE